MKWYWWALIIIILIVFRKKVVNTWNDLVTWKRIEELHPAIREKARAFIKKAAEQGIFLRVTEAYRSFERSDELYAQGRTKPGSIVSNARGGESYHNYGLAFDVVEMKDGKGLWENPNWPKIGALGKEFGFRWGGDFKSLQDLPHFEYGGKLSTLLARYRAGEKDSNGFLTNVA